MWAPSSSAHGHAQTRGQPPPCKRQANGMSWACDSSRWAGGGLAMLEHTKGIATLEPVLSKHHPYTAHVQHGDRQYTSWAVVTSSFQCESLPFFLSVMIYPGWRGHRRDCIQVTCMLHPSRGGGGRRGSGMRASLFTPSPSALVADPAARMHRSPASSRPVQCF
jgi:hypothetical protein